MAWRLLGGDLRDPAVLAAFEADMFDAVLCDPPYGLGPDGIARDWDSISAGRASGGFCGESWDSAVPGASFWRAVLRIVKPGAPVVSFGGTRTYHRMVCAVEDAGFRVRDQIDWRYGQGWPKGSSVSKMIDAVAGATRAVVGTRVLQGTAALSTKEKGGTYSVGASDAGRSVTVDVTESATEEAKRWDGYHTQLRPSHEPAVLARKPLEGTIVENALLHGVGAMHIDACRLPRDYAERSEAWRASGHSQKPDVAKIAAPPGIGINLHADGGWPSNAVVGHSPRCVKRGIRRVRGHKGYPNGPGGSSSQISQRGVPTTRTEAWAGHADADGGEGQEDWECADGCEVAALDGRAGDRPSGGRSGVYGATVGGVSFHRESQVGRPVNPCVADEGGASRFFKVVSWTDEDLDAATAYYCAKASRSEREFGCDRLPLVGGVRNHHKTIKPVALTQWLATLILPPPRIDGRPRRILIPFAGAGSEMIGAVRAGFDEVIGIEREDDYRAIAEARLRRWDEVPTHVDAGDVKPEKADERQVGLFDNLKETA